MLHLREIAILRTQLRNVNIEYSALVRTNGGEGRFVRMDELGTRRRALMALIAEAKRPSRREAHQVVSAQQPREAAVEHAA